MSTAKPYPRIVKEVIKQSQSKKAKNICVLDIRKQSSAADYFIICHGDSDVQVKAISDAILQGLKTEGFRPWHKEGYQYLHWVLIDYVDIVVHVFHRETRQYYQLERIWGDAEIQIIQDENEN